MFKIIGVLLALYLGWSVATGDVYARAGVWGRTYRRAEDGWRNWSAILEYALLVVALHQSGERASYLADSWAAV